MLHLKAIAAAIMALSLAYPEARLQDIYKIFYQDRFGPGHLLADTARAKRYLESELAESDLIATPLFEPTGWNHQFYRVSLSIVKKGLISKEAYFDAFYRSTTNVPPFTTEQWREEWQAIVGVVSRSKLRPEGFEADSIRIDSMMRATPTAVHHSRAYNQTYHPHYRIIAKDIFEQEILPLLPGEEASEPIARQDISPTTLIVTYESPKAKKRLLRELKRMKAEVIYDYNIIPGMAIKKPLDMTLESTKRRLEGIEGVTNVDYDHIMHTTNTYDL